MTRSSRIGDTRFAIVPFLVFSVVAALVLAINLQHVVDLPGSLLLQVAMLSWGAVFVWRRRLDVRALVGGWPSPRVLLRWCAIGVAGDLLLLAAVVLLVAAGDGTVDIDRTLGFGKVFKFGTLAIVLTVCLVPFSDAFLFQGLVMGDALRRMGARSAVLLSATIAAIVHADVLLLAHFGAAIVLAVAWLETRSLWVPIVMQFMSFACVIALGSVADVVDRLVPALGQHARTAWQGASVGGGVFVLLMAWLALVAWVFLRVPAAPRSEPGAPLAAA